MALAHINNRVQGGSDASSSTIVSPPASHTAGDGLVVLVSSFNAATVSSVTNTAGDTWVQAGSTYVCAFSSYSIFYVSSSAGHATDVVTVTLSVAASWRSIVVHEISGQITSGTLNTTASASGTGTTISSGTITRVAPEEFIVALMITGTGGTKTAGSGYTLTNFAVSGDAVTYFADEWKIVTASEAATATQSSDTWDILAASFKVAAFEPRFIKSVMPRVAVHRASSW